MPKFKNAVAAIILATIASVTASADIDPALKSMLEVAAKSDDANQLATIEKIAIATWPEQAEAIKAMIAALSQPEAQQGTTPEALLVAEAAADELSEKRTKIKQASTAFKHYLDPALWNGQLELGGGSSTGNTEEQGISIGLSFKRIFNEKWEHDLDTDFDYSKAQGVTTKQKIVGQYKVLWKPWDQFYTMNFIRVDADKFSGYKYRITENIGVGYEIINKSNMRWRIEGGPGMRVNKFDVTNVSETEFLGRISNTFEMDLWENIKMSNRSSAIFTADSTTYDNKAQLSARINAHLAAKLSFSITHDTGPPLGKEKTDTVSRATIVYDF